MRTQSCFYLMSQSQHSQVIPPQSQPPVSRVTGDANLPAYHSSLMLAKIDLEMQKKQHQTRKKGILKPTIEAKNHPACFLKINKQLLPHARPNDQEREKRSVWPLCPFRREWPFFTDRLSFPAYSSPYNYQCGVCHWTMQSWAILRPEYAKHKYAYAGNNRPSFEFEAC